ncbi:hypothetical protein CCUG63695_03551 [Mycobacteroides franklinii]|uniref:Uncharacterized protein n=1 Tax=Mycobacteroides franklinii TaxID=948102 RepID=A0A4R8R3H2_9MYCO|nr:hypothetical protein CCUG64054_03624 [Mycobacteroides franklinii]TDZ50701.1 hypothetical protein CCUG63697_02210 [Mycobacteroides franklinii]TDZ57121.1 hypothetical protein CCUG63696_03626 [Mycobacteroides franklinii]TDZ64062.1 hypothetical protein CCUG63695_03551 [Mycobacteroides franklinii]TDZ70459.1 hypothetical protein CCUG64056_03624 [Mycobacteroides franklinii]
MLGPGDIDLARFYALAVSYAGLTQPYDDKDVAYGIAGG